MNNTAMAEENPKHSVLGASATYRYLNCAGSVQLAEGMPRQSSSHYAEEGTAAHIVCDECLHDLECDPASFLGFEIATPEGSKILVTQDMVDAVTVYVTYCRELATKATLFGNEARVDLQSYLAFAGVKARAWGTTDCFGVYDNVLEVVDYKHGQGVSVSPVESGQLMFYALGTLASEAVRTRNMSQRIEWVKLTIVQPRAGDPRPESWTLSVGALLDWCFDVLIPGMEKTLSPDATLQPGDWCRWCPARVRCPELRKQALQSAQMEFSPIPPTASDLTDEELGAVMDKVELMRVFMAACQGEASSRTEAGRTIPGWKLVEKRAMRKWADVDAAKEHLDRYGGAVREALYEPKRLKTVAQAEKAMKRLGLLDEWSDAQTLLVEKTSSGSTLVPDGDPRERLEAIVPGSEFSPVVY